MPNNNLRAGKINGAVFAADPINQNYIYTANVSNQPLIGNLGRGLEAQRLLGLSSLSQNTFTPDQERFVVSFLLDKHPAIYNNIMVGQTGDPNRVIW